MERFQNKRGRHRGNELNVNKEIKNDLKKYEKSEMGDRI